MKSKIYRLFYISFHLFISILFLLSLVEVYMFGESLTRISTIILEVIGLYLVWKEPNKILQVIWMIIYTIIPVYYLYHMISFGIWFYSL